MNLTAEQAKQLIRQQVSEKRYYHSLCVAEEALALAERFGADPQQAELAGLLHDIMKDTEPEKQLKMLEESGIILTKAELASPAVWHQYAGAEYLRRAGVGEESILSAIACHTTGKRNMTLPEKVLFVADAVSRDRHYEGVEKIRQALETGLDEAVAAGTGSIISSFSAKGLPIAEKTLEAYNDAVLLLKCDAERTGRKGKNL